MITKTCRICGKQFQTDDANQRICPNTHFNTCLTCGKKFPVAKDGKTSNYCSQKCNNNKPEWVRREMYGTRICEICGKEFVPKQKSQNICSTVHYLPCPVCGKQVKNVGHKRQPKCCSNKCTQELKRRTCMEKYGVPVSSQADSVKRKAEQTCMEHYGVKHAAQSEEIKLKTKEGFVKKYGVDNPMKLQQCKDKLKETSLEKYGVDHPWKDAEVQEKRKQTWMDKYGVDNPNKVKAVRYKQKKTLMERYGVDSPVRVPGAIDKMYESNVARYGTWYLDSKENRSNRSRPVSKRNLQFSESLTANNVEHEMESYFSDAKRRKFDFDITGTNVLVELDSTAVHNSYKHINNVPYTNEITDMQLNKSKLAWEHGKYCIHVFDWDNTDLVIKYLAPRKYSIPASFLSKITTDRMQCIKFFKDNNVQLVHNIEEYNSFALLGINDVPVYCIAYMQAANNNVRCSVCVANDYSVSDASAAVVKHCTLDGYISVVLDASKYIPVYGFDVSFDDLSSCTPIRVWSKASDVKRSDLEETETSESYCNRIQQAWLPVHTCGFVSVNVE